MDNYTVGDIISVICLEVIDMSPKPLPLDVNDIVRRYKSGESEKAISELLSVSRTAIRRRLLMAGITPNNRSRAMYIMASKLTPEERRRRTKAANAAARGRKVPIEERCKVAASREKSKKGISHLENSMEKILRKAGFEPVPQKAIGPYNCDLAVHPVAVEIFGGGWHFSGSHLARTPDRIRYLMDHGWHVLMVVIDARRFPLTTEVGNYVISYIKNARRHPSAVREYRVVRGAGHYLASGCADDNEISIIPAFTTGRNTLGQYTAVPR